MTFEKALEAMKQGKKITCKGSEFYYFMSRENEIRCINFVIGYETTVKFFCSDILSGKWEIYEEPQKEPEMTAEKNCDCMVHPVEWCTTTLACTENDNSEIINELKKEVRETIGREIKRIYYAEKAGLI